MFRNSIEETTLVTSSVVDHCLCLVFIINNKNLIFICIYNCIK